MAKFRGREKRVLRAGYWGVLFPHYVGGRVFYSYLHLCLSRDPSRVSSMWRVDYALLIVQCTESFSPPSQSQYSVLISLVGSVNPFLGVLSDDTGYGKHLVQRNGAVHVGSYCNGIHNMFALRCQSWAK